MQAQAQPSHRVILSASKNLKEAAAKFDILQQLLCCFLFLQAPCQGDQGLQLSVRTCNCLRRARCLRIRDIAALSQRDISQIRSLGAISADEIARALRALGIRYAKWDNYLLCA